MFSSVYELLSCQPRVTFTSCFVFLNLSGDNLCIRVSSSGVYKLKYYLTVVNIIQLYCHSWLVRQQKDLFKVCYYIWQSKEEGKDQESIQSSTLPE